MHGGAAAAQGTEDPDDEPVDVEQRQTVGDDVDCVHAQASASASRFEAIARRGSTAPLGGPVVPEV